MQYQPFEGNIQGDVWSVSRLNSEVRAVLEGCFPLLWVAGEISNLAQPPSGHIYFTLKDQQAQVRCAMFRMRRQYLRFLPENGTQVLLRCRVGLYEGRGEFQLLVEHMQPAGEGALRLAFEALKAKLSGEGLFDTDRKRPLPAYPKRIGIITSPTGAAVHDILTVLQRRYPAAAVVIYPVQVQGKEAAAEITAMLRLAEQRAECDLLILTRGGGSLEDLAAFNDEEVARTIHACSLPVVSAVGHEIDFTIADFVADLRAPTPSAAAELVTPDGQELFNKIALFNSRIALQCRQLLARDRSALQHLQGRLVRLHPEYRLTQWQQRLDELQQRLLLAIRNDQRQRASQLKTLHARISAYTPIHALHQLREQQRSLCGRLNRAIGALLLQRRQLLAKTAANLHTLSPLATLERGYSITRRVRDGVLLLDATQVAQGDRVETLLARGRLTCEVVALNSNEGPEPF
ncbi:MAG: exodeoxyribonuclease VII large subunit [Gammaproteobacteria bacterium]|nr:exodeoxyribonuclease VII large subunit [Gammaproteobacteria bacterium]